VFAVQSANKAESSLPSSAGTSLLTSNRWRTGCISSTDHKGRPIWVVAAEREDDRRFIVHAHDMPTGFLELRATIHRKLRAGWARGGYDFDAYEPERH
jgi:hypothetical protein